MSTDLIKVLSELPKELRTPIRAALKKWSDDGRNTARQLAPIGETDRSKYLKGYRPGTLRRSIRAHVMRNGLLAVFGIYGNSLKQAFYGRFIEFGTQPHDGHPGTRENPFLRTAGRQVGPAGAQVVIAAVRAAINAATTTGNQSRMIPLSEGLLKLSEAGAKLRSSQETFNPENTGGEQPD